MYPSRYIPSLVWNVVGWSRGLDSGLLTVLVWRREAPEVLRLEPEGLINIPF